MKRLRVGIIGVSLMAGVSLSLAQDNPPQDPVPEAVPPTPPPRVVGQVRTAEEQNDWNVIINADEASKSALAKQFLQNHPDSGMTPHAHWVIAMDAYRKQDFPSFTMHGEASLKELDSAVDLRSQLAFYYAETGQFEKAIEHSDALSSTLATIENRTGMTAAQWAQSKDQMAAAASYARGRALLGRYSSSGDSAQLDQAIVHLRKAITHNPADDYAYFRLGEAYRSKDDPEKAVLNYAMAAAIGGPAAGSARSILETLYRELEQDPALIEERIQQQKAYLEKRKQAKQEEYQQAAEEAKPPSQPPS